jgi:alpha-L-fucosidase
VARAFADDASTTTAVTYNATMAADPSTVAAGGTTTVTGSGFTPCAEVTLTLHSDPVALGTVTADATGAFSKPVTIPASTPAGSHTITGTAGSTNGIVTLTVTAAGTTTSAGSGSSSSTAAVTPAQSGGPLAFTGAHAALYSGLGLLLVLAGGAVAYLARRRRLENARWHEI